MTTMKRGVIVVGQIISLFLPAWCVAVSTDSGRPVQDVCSETCVSSQRTQIILDTDMDTDCDDAGALAVMHALQRRGVTTLLGVVCSIPNPDSAWCVLAINDAYDATDIPVGLVRISDWETNPRYEKYRKHQRWKTRDGTTPLYNQILGREVQDHSPETVFPDAVAQYRTLLAQAADRSITICVVGTLTSLAKLLESPADEISPLTGKELVAVKVCRLVTMAKAFPPSGKDTFNWAMDLPAAAKVLSEWPTELVVSSMGNEVKTGARLMAMVPPNHPVHRAYRIFLYKANKKNRPSWDQLAAIYAAERASERFVIERESGLLLDPQTGVYQWVDQEGGHLRTHLSSPLKPHELAQYVEDLMIESIRCSQPE